MREPLGLCLEILRLRSFVHAWDDAKRPRNKGEKLPSGKMAETAKRIADRLAIEGTFARQALADLRALRNGT